MTRQQIFVFLGRCFRARVTFVDAVNAGPEAEIEEAGSGPLSSLQGESGPFGRGDLRRDRAQQFAKQRPRHVSQRFRNRVDSASSSRTMISMPSRIVPTRSYS